MEHIWYIFTIVMLVILNYRTLKQNEKLVKTLNELADKNVKFLIDKIKKDTITNVMDKLKNPPKKE